MTTARTWCLKLTLLILALFTLNVLSRMLTAQTTNENVTILLLSGKDGKPIARHRLLIFYGETEQEAHTQRHSIDLMTDDAGVAASSQLPVEAKWIEVWPDWLRMCQDKPKREFSIADLTTVGARTENTCGKATQEVKAGRLILFVRPLTFIEK